MSGLTAPPAGPALGDPWREDTTRRAGGLARRAWAWGPVVLIFAFQAAASARLYGLGVASGDEARYIYAGHQLIHELWHGGGSPYYDTYFSGAPDLYPVLAAMADAVGGLVAARLMSLVFMLTATGMLFATTRRLFGYWPGIVAAGLFAGLGLTQDLGALATHDALSLMLVTVAAYCAVRTGDGEQHAGRWLLLVPLTLLAANAVKYVTVLFDPTVMGIAALQVYPRGMLRVLQRLMVLAGTTVFLLVVAVALAGQAYLNGILFSTLARQRGSSAVFATQVAVARVASPTTIAKASWAWTGAVLALAALGLLMALLARGERRHLLLLALALATGLIMTAGGIYLHSVESMRKHDDYGIWFTCIAAGYTVARATSPARGRVVRSATAGLALLGVTLSGFHYTRLASSTYEAKNSTTNLIAYNYLKAYLELPNARYLIGGLDNEEIVYAEHLSIPWYRLFDDVYLKYPIPGRGGDSHGEKPGAVCKVLRPGCVYLEGPAAYRAAIHAHWFALVSMVGGHSSAQDATIEATLNSTPGYVQITDLGGAPTWIYAPAYRSP